MIRRKIKSFCIVSGMLAAISLHAQFKDKAMLEPVKKAGFYSIYVTPELSGYVKTDFSDLRIMDEEEKPVPYIISNGITRQYDTTFAWLRIHSNMLDDSGFSAIVIENNMKAPLSSIALLIRNNSVSRYVDVLGSDEGLHWYSIIERGVLHQHKLFNGDRYVQAIEFPLSSYRYLKLVIDNGKKAPLNIISAGVYKVTSQQNDSSLIKNPQCKFIQTDSTDGNSYIHVIGEAPVHKLLVKLTIAGQRFYYRAGRIIANNKIICGFMLSADTASAVVLPAFNAKDWWIQIGNGDNPRLKVTGVFTFEEQKKIIAWLDPGKTYHLEMNDSLAAAPVYDLENFRDSIPGNIVQIKFGDIQPIIAASTLPAVSFFKQSWLWPVLFVVLAVLVFFTVRLIREVSAKR